MADKWFLMEGGIRKGPLTRRQLETQIVEGAVNERSWIWRKGMPDWSIAQNVPEVQPAIERSRIVRSQLASRMAPSAGQPGTWSPAPGAGYPQPQPPYPSPVAQPHPGALPSSTGFDTTPKPWRRFVARVIDSFAYAPVSIIGMILLSFMIGLDNLQIEQYVAISFISLFFVFILDSLLVSWFSTTPGKWLLGLRLQKGPGGALSIPEAMARNIGVFIIGHGGGLLFFLAWPINFQRLVQSGRVYYDQIGGFDVVSERIRWGRVALGVLVLIPVYGISVFFNILVFGDLLRF